MATITSVAGLVRRASAGRSAMLVPITLALLTALGSPASRAAVPLEIYGHLPSIEDAALSPGGTRVAFVRTEGDTRLVVIASLAEHKLIGGLRVGTGKLRRIRWADDDHLMVITSATSLPIGLINTTDVEWLMLQVYDVKRNRAIALPTQPFKQNIKIMNVMSGSVMVRRIDGHTVLFVPGVYVADVTLPALFRCDLTSGDTQVVRQGEVDTKAWLVDDHGDVIAEKDYEERGQRWTIKIRRGRGLAEAAAGQAAIESPQLLGFGPSADTLLIAMRERGEPVWRLMSLKDGALAEPMAARTLLEDPIEDPVTHRLIGGMHRGDAPAYLFFDPQTEDRWQAIVGTFAGERVRYVSSSADFSQVIVLVEGARHGYRYMLVDLANHTAGSLGEVYKGVNTPLEVRRVTYAAADGLRIPAYLTLPAGRAKGLPLVVLPHGGPAQADSAEFDWWSQALADQGYAVLQPNYRGSTVNRAFHEAGFGEWGRKMQTDLSDGVRYLVKEGIADPARVCIVGASYGGYAALAGVTLDPSVYRCAVSVAGLSDLARMLNWEAERHALDDQRAVRSWDRFMGVSGPKDPALDAISPIKHVDAVHVPVLLIHGRDDTVVPFEQSQVMFDALRRAHKDVQLVTLENEDHWLSRSETRLKMLQATVAFLRAHDPPD